MNTESQPTKRIYRRHVRLAASSTSVVSEMADDAHHFRVRLTHDHERVVTITGEAIRYPWTTCPGSTERLSVFEGISLAPRSTVVGAHASASEHCTHLFDLAGLAVAHAARNAEDRLYECAVEGAPTREETATVTCNGEMLIEWHLSRGKVKAPAAFSDAPIRGGRFIDWAERELDPDLAEAALVLRRALLVSPVRLHELDRFERATDLLYEPGACFTFSEGTKQLAVRMKNTQFDFTDSPLRLLAGGGS